MKDLDVAKSLIASLQAQLDKLADDLGHFVRASISLCSDVHAIREGLDEALRSVCMGDVRADADTLIERAKEAQAHE